MSLNRPPKPIDLEGIRDPVLRRVLNDVYETVAPLNISKPTITGSKGGNAALADLLTKLAALGLITDSTVSQAEVVQQVANKGWAPTNVTTDKVFDANATSIDELADVLGTLITALKSQGLLAS